MALPQYQINPATGPGPVSAKPDIRITSEHDVARPSTALLLQNEIERRLTQPTGRPAGMSPRRRLAVMLGLGLLAWAPPAAALVYFL